MKAPTQPTAADGIVSVFNKGSNTYQHGVFSVKPGTMIDVPAEVADIWSTITEGGVNVLVSGYELKGPAPKSEKLEAENAELRAANREAQLQQEKLEAEIKGLQTLLESQTRPPTQ